MRKMTHDEIRTMWFEFFSEKNHQIIESASLIPIDDNSLLWINAGVAPLKKYFDGSVIPDNKRLTSIQKCIRTNDIENVGVTKRHQTFFEMMGNFSIGDYFKEEACEWAFELLTSDKWFAIPLDKLYFTVYTKDQKTFDKWLTLGVSEDHIAKLDGNYWEIGEGPCGPDTEIFFDRGEKYDKEGTALENFFKDEEQERYVEIWNNVFSQYNAKKDLPRNKYKELPHKNIDTGAGLERWCTVFQDVDSNFDTDLLFPIIRGVENLSGILYDDHIEAKIIADHVKALTFALADGAYFENIGRGYVLRRLLRRSVRMGKKIGLNEPFMYKLVSYVIDTMKEAYPYLEEKQGVVKTQILAEERLFHQTLSAGEKRLYQLMDESLDKTISGQDAFKLYDTYGFPFELTLEYLEEKGFTVSKEEYDKYMEEQKKLAKASMKKNNSFKTQQEALMSLQKESTFIYDQYELKSSIVALIKDDSLVKELEKEGYVVLKKTCFYATGGGQVHDTGMIIGKDFKARVTECFKGPNGQNIHKVKILKGKILLKDDCELVVDKERREQIERNHSSVHLLQYALRSEVSDTIKQAGSQVDNEKLRFDFTFTGKIMDNDLIKVENRVNELISASIMSLTEEMEIEAAKEKGALALFSEKYKDQVRVVTLGDSVELCGGTHVRNTKDIKKFAILSCSSIGSNTYRIEATTGIYIENALFLQIKPYNDEMIKQLMKAKTIVTKAKNEGINLVFDVDINNDKPTSYQDIIYNKNELEYVQSEVKQLEKAYLEEQQKNATSDLTIYLDKKEVINSINTIIYKTTNQDSNVLKTIADSLANQLQNALIIFANIKEDNTVNFVIRSNSNISAGNIIKSLTSKTSGNGGGSNTFASGAGKDISNIDNILEEIKKEIN